MDRYFGLLYSNPGGPLSLMPVLRTKFSVGSSKLRGALQVRAAVGAFEPSTTNAFKLSEAGTCSSSCGSSRSSGTAAIVQGAQLAAHPGKFRSMPSLARSRTLLHYWNASRTGRSQVSMYDASNTTNTPICYTYFRNTKILRVRD